MACDFDPYAEVNAWREIHPLDEHNHEHHDELMTDEERHFENHDFSVYSQALYVHDTHFAYIDELIHNQEHEYAKKNEKDILDKHHVGEFEGVAESDSGDSADEETSNDEENNKE